MAIFHIYLCLHLSKISHCHGSHKRSSARDLRCPGAEGAQGSTPLEGRQRHHSGSPDRHCPLMRSISRMHCWVAPRGCIALDAQEWHNVFYVSSRSLMYCWCSARLSPNRLAAAVVENVYCRQGTWMVGEGARGYDEVSERELVMIGRRYSRQSKPGFYGRRRWYL